MIADVVIDVAALWRRAYRNAARSPAATHSNAYRFQVKPSDVPVSQRDDAGCNACRENPDYPTTLATAHHPPADFLDRTLFPQLMFNGSGTPDPVPFRHPLNISCGISKVHKCSATFLRNSLREQVCWPIHFCYRASPSTVWAISFLNSTFVPGCTMEPRSSASQLVSRMQPCEKVVPILPGSGVPWMP